MFVVFVFCSAIKLFVVLQVVTEVLLDCFTSLGGFLLFPSSDVGSMIVGWVD